MPEVLPPSSGEKFPQKNKRKFKKFTFLKKKKLLDSSREQAINEQLTAIYQGTDGKIPNMKKIELKKSNIFLKILLYVLIFGSLLSIIAWINFFSSSTHESSDQYIQFEISGPTAVTFGNTTTYIISYKNLDKNSLKNATLDIRYPTNFLFVSSSVLSKNAGHTEIDLGTILPNSQKSIAISGLFLGKTNEEGIWRASLNFQPENIKSPLIKTIAFKNKINNSPFVVSITAPDKLKPNEDVELKFTVTKKIPTQVTQLEFAPLVPFNFEINSSSPKLDRTNRWVIDKFSTSSSEMTFIIQGKSRGISETTIGLKAQLFFKTPSKEFNIAEANLGSSSAIAATDTTSPLELSINDSLNSLSIAPGGLLRIKNTIKNSTSKTLKNASLKLILEAPSLNKQSILNWNEIKDAYNGDIHGEQINSNIRQGQITWDKKAIPSLAELQPNQTTAIELQLPVKQSKKFNFQNITSFTIRAHAELHFTDNTGAEKSLLSNPVTITLNSDTAFEVRSNKLINDQHQEEYEISWLLTNSLHPLKDIRISASTEGDISWKESSSTPAGQGIFDEKTHQIIWNIPEMPESVDVLAWPFSIVINKRDPSFPISISQIKIEATDTITNEKISSSNDKLILK